MRASLCLLLTVLASADAAAQSTAIASRASAVRRVLLLHSYEQGGAWPDAVTSGVRDTLDGAGVSVELWIEYLDVHRHSSPAHLARAFDVVRGKAAEIPFDIVVASDDAAAALVADNLDTAFTGQPIVVIGLGERSLVDRFPAGKVTALLEDIDANQMPTLADRLRPGTRHFVVVTDNTRTGASVLQRYRDYARTRPDLTFEWIDGRDVPLDRIVERVGRVESSAAIILSSFRRDRDERHYPQGLAVRRIAEAAAAPIYTPILSSMGQGMMIGFENRGYRHGTWAAQQVLRLIENPSAPLTALVPEAAGRVVADVQALARWGVPRDRLPPGTIFVNEPPSFYRANKQAVWTAVAVAILQSLAIIALVVNVNRRHRAERALRSRTDHLERTLVELERARIDRLEMEERLRQSQRLESMGRLAGGIAHDFNNLLTVILSYVELASSEVRPGSLLESHLGQIKLAGGSAADLTRQILAFSRRQVLSPENVDVNALVRESYGLISRLLSENIETTLELAEPLPRVRIDRTQLQQVLMNLAVNARDAMQHGGRLRIETAAMDIDSEYAASHPTLKTGPSVVITVADTGEGIAPDVLEHIFDPFFTTKPKGRGTGLGLASVYGTVKQSGGWIFASSEVGQGTTFRIHFPALATTEQYGRARSGTSTPLRAH